MGGLVAGTGVMILAGGVVLLKKAHTGDFAGYSVVLSFPVGFVMTVAGLALVGWGLCLILS